MLTWKSSLWRTGMPRITYIRHYIFQISALLHKGYKRPTNASRIKSAADQSQSTLNQISKIWEILHTKLSTTTPKPSMQNQKNTPHIYDESLSCIRDHCTAKSTNNYFISQLHRITWLSTSPTHSTDLNSTQLKPISILLRIHISKMANLGEQGHKHTIHLCREVRETETSRLRWNPKRLRRQEENDGWIWIGESDSCTTLLMGFRMGEIRSYYVSSSLRSKRIRWS